MHIMEEQHRREEIWKRIQAMLELHDWLPLDDSRAATSLQCCQRLQVYNYLFQAEAGIVYLWATTLKNALLNRLNQNPSACTSAHAHLGSWQRQYWKSHLYCDGLAVCGFGSTEALLGYF